MPLSFRFQGVWVQVRAHFEPVPVHEDLSEAYLFLQAGAFGYSAEDDEDDDGGSEDDAIAPGPSPVEKVDRFVPWQNRPLWNICKCCDDEVGHLVS